MKSWPVVAALAALAIAGCGGSNSKKNPQGPACSNGVDDDGDGLVDFPADPGCTGAADTTEDSAPSPQCSDGRDNDGDGKIDYPNDPGCVAPQQDDETDDCPDGPTCPQCANGKDDDANGLTDFPADPGCTSAGDPDEYTEDPSACGATLMVHQLPVTGMDSGMIDSAALFSQLSPCGGGDGTQIAVVAYELHLTEAKVIVASTEGSAIDTVLDLRSAACDGAASELACSDDVATGNFTSSLTASLQPGTYYLLVESKTNTAGAYTLSVQEFAGEGEPCTDPSQCGPGLVCRTPLGGSAMVCSQPMCNDGVDDDGDGKADYPDDPGCTAGDDNDETDDCPSGTNCPQCANGVDDDGDGLIDYPADTSCTSASGTTEASCPMEMDNEGAITMPMTAGDLGGLHADQTLACSSATGNDATYFLPLPVPVTSLTIDTNGSAIADTVLQLWQDACASSLACDDDSGDGNLSQISEGPLPAGTYAITVAAYSSSNNGMFNLDVHGTIAAGTSCESTLAQNGVLTCEPGFVCAGTVGSRTCLPAACNNGIDDDGDGHTDFPDDPGCTDTADNDETDDCPSGATCPQCANGIDDDGDGAIDYPADPSCSAASSASEATCPLETDPVTPVTMPTTTGTLAGLHHDLALACQSDTGNDATFSLHLDLPVASLTVDTNGSTVVTDTVIAVWNDACSTGLGCDDDGGDGLLSSLTLTNVSPGSYAITVAGFSDTNNDAFQLNVHGTLALGTSCESPLVDSGILACDTGLQCSGTPGARTCAPVQCGNGVDDDGDGLIDFPDDPGCTDTADPDETDDCPSGPTCPVCANGLDDDGDGVIDYPNDPSCAAASGTSEATCPIETDPITPIKMPTTTGTLAGLNHDLTLTCQSNTGNDATFSLQLDVPVSNLTLDTNGSTGAGDTVLEVWNDACTTGLACDDDGGDGLLSSITMTDVAPGSYAVTVAGYSTSNNDAFQLDVHGTLAAGTRCDSALFAAGVLACDTGLTCTGTPATCQ